MNKKSYTELLKNKSRNSGKDNSQLIEELYESGIIYQNLEKWAEIAEILIGRYLKANEEVDEE